MPDVWVCWPALSALSCQNLDPKLTFLHDLEATFLLDQSFSSFTVRAHGQGLSNQLDLVCRQIKFTWLWVWVINFSLWIRDIQKHSIAHKRLYIMSKLMMKLISRSFVNFWIHLLKWTLRPIDIESLAGSQLNAIESIFLHFYIKFTTSLLLHQANSCILQLVSS